MEKKDLKKTPQDSGETSEKKRKAGWAMLAPMLSAVLVAACVGVSLSSYTPAVYEVQAEPVKEEAEEPEEETGETEEEELAETASQQTTGQGETSVAAVEDAAAYRDGEYYGSATGFAGPIQVKVVVSGGKIASIEIVSTSDGSEFISRASAIIEKMVSGQTTNVDTVSGATYSSVGIINAVRNALAQAATSAAAEETQTVATVPETTGNTNQTGTTAQNGNANSQTQTDPVTPTVTGNFPYPDGTYYGKADGFEDIIKVAVVIKDKTIASVTVVEESDDEPFFTNASALLSKVVESQTTAVDTVSGATYSSKGILGAIDAALAEAKAAANSGSGDTGNGGSGDNENGNSESSDNQNTAEAKIYNNGAYTVTVSCEPDDKKQFTTYKLTATVTIAGDKITGLSDVSGDGDTINNIFITKAVSGASEIQGMQEKILAMQSAQLSEGVDLTAADTNYRVAIEALDAVSGATCTSNSIKQACLEALTQAKEAMTQANGTAE